MLKAMNCTKNVTNPHRVAKTKALRRLNRPTPCCANRNAMPSSIKWYMPYAVPNKMEVGQIGLPPSGLTGKMTLKIPWRQSARATPHRQYV